MIDGALEARREMSEMLLNEWAVTNWTALGFAAAPVIHWEGRDDDAPPPNDAPYVAFYIKHATAYQEALAGDSAQVLWGRDGVLTALCFGNLSSGNGLEQALKMATVAQRVFQGKSSVNCIWFRNATIREIGRAGGWYQVNLTATFTYDEVR